MYLRVNPSRVRAEPHAGPSLHAAHHEVPASQLIREALEQYVSEQEAQLEPEPLPDWVGMLEGPGGPYASRDEEILGETWADSIDPREA